VSINCAFCGTDVDGELDEMSGMAVCAWRMPERFTSSTGGDS
jgi:hypothetical protein